MKNENIKTDVEKACTQDGNGLIFRWLLYFAVIFLITFTLSTGLKKYFGTEYPLAAIVSNSMWPAIKEGDIVLIRGVDAKSDVNLGDVVVYRTEDAYIIHRVIAKDEDAVITKGDSNEISDDPITYDSIVGKAVTVKNKIFRIPWLGKVVDVIK
jgi:signal peptidase I